MSNKETNTLILLHLAVFLAGWTGIFGRLITLGGLPLVWYRIMVSVTVLAAVLCCFLRKHPGLKRIHRRCLHRHILLLHHVAGPGHQPEKDLVDRSAYQFHRRIIKAELSVR